MYNGSQHLMNGGGQRGFGGMPLNMSKPFPHQGHQGQQHQHQDPNNAQGHGNAYSHHQHSHSGGMTNGGGHFAGTNHLQNGSQGLGFGGMSKPPSEHWNQQMQLAQQARDWSGNKVTHAYARIAQGSSKDLVTTTASMLASDNDKEKRQRPGNDDASSKSKNQSWTELDLGGQAIRNLSQAVFNYRFLTKLYFNNNKLTSVPKEIGQLRTLKTLDLSVNELHSIPSQIGMLVNLKELLLFDNKIRTLPFEVGNLYQCAMLGLEGNPLNEDLKSVIMEQGSLELIKYLRENAPCKSWFSTIL
jgi:CCR4-NOT transcription complex subunit 6